MSRPLRVVSALLGALLATTLVGPPALAAPRPTPRTAATSSTAAPAPRAFLLADAGTGRVLAAGNEHTALPPASTVKIMTGLTALRRLPAGATVKVSARAAAQPSMRIGMHEGEVWTLDDVLHTLYLVSANDAAYALAEAAGGTVEQFATLMDDTARQLGMSDSSFHDPAGLDDGASVNGGSRMSAWDLAIATRNALQVPQIADTVKLVDYEFTAPDGVRHTLHNHNAQFLRQYAGATGMKTGYTSKAGRGLVCTATRDGRTMIGVVLDVYDTTGSCERLLDQGFASKADAAGTGEVLPEVKIFTAAQRDSAIAGIPRSLGRPRLSEITGTTAAPATAAPRPAPRHRVATPAAPRTEESSVLPTILWAIGGFAVALVAFVAWRRRVVRRRRRTRSVRRKTMAEARRRGMLHVLDADARPGPSHVSVLPRERIG
ncbi:MAG: serine hydrolase [Acidimicrobiia bacterium]